MNGIFIIDKPGGMTSHDVVNHIRAKFGISRVGHLGTLDPMATGVLPVCLGKATRMGQFIPNSPKEYTGEIRFGFSTNTFDREGSPASEVRPLQSSRVEIEEAMRSLTGRLNQMPPAFSAKKIGGVASYKLARRNRPVEMAPVSVEVQQFTALEFAREGAVAVDPKGMPARKAVARQPLTHDHAGLCLLLLQFPPAWTPASERSLP